MARSRIAFVLLGLALVAPAGASVRAPAPPPEVVAAQKACEASGLAPGSDAFQKCVAQKLGPPPPPPPQVLAAIEACKAKGLAQGTKEFAACVGAQTAKTPPPPPGQGAKPPPGQGSKPPTPEQQAAMAACKAKGLAEGSEAHKQCVMQETARGPEQTPVQQAAIDACKAKGIPQLTEAFKQCVKDYATNPANNNKSLTPKQLAAFDACKAKGISIGSDAFKRCLDAQLTTVTKAARDDAEAELKAAVAACNAKRLKAEQLRQCIQARLGK